MSEADSISNGLRQHIWHEPLRLFHWLLVVVNTAAFRSAEENSAVNHCQILPGWIAAIPSGLAAWIAAFLRIDPRAL